MDVRAPIDPFFEGLAHHRAGRLAAAAECYRRAIRVNERHADALHLAGVIEHQLGRHETAIASIRRAIEIQPAAPAFHSNLGAALEALGRHAEAIAAFEQSLQLDPRSAGVRYNLGRSLARDGRHAAAAAELRHSLAIDDRGASAWTELGAALRRLDQFDESIQCHTRAIELSPRSADVWQQLGLAYRDAGRFPQAADCFLRTSCLDRTHADAVINLGNVYEDSGDFARAIACYERAGRLSPNQHAAPFNRALALLRQGNLAEGWAAYESRWKHNGKPRLFAEPEWNGEADASTSLFIYGEQGVGDEVMFASCYAEAIARVGRCTIECEPRLRPLFERSFPHAEVFSRAGEIDPGAVQSRPRWNRQIAAGSLPKLLRQSFEQFPTHAGYLRADPERHAFWRGRFASLGAKCVVGISWEGGRDPAIRRRRSTTLAMWRSILSTADVVFVSLQHGADETQLAAFEAETRLKLHRWKECDPLRELDGFAAQVAALDLVISVDNANVHLAGALGVPVWTLLPFSCDWRWFADRLSSPWYPSMRLYRCHSPREWESLIAEVGGDLARFRDRLPFADAA